MCVFLISPVPIAEPLTSELIDTPVFYNLAPRPIKYRVSVPIPSHISLLLFSSFVCFGRVNSLICLIHRVVHLFSSHLPDAQQFDMHCHLPVNFGTEAHEIPNYAK